MLSNFKLKLKPKSLAHFGSGVTDTGAAPLHAPWRELEPPTGTEKRPTGGILAPAKLAHVDSESHTEIDC